MIFIAYVLTVYKSSSEFYNYFKNLILKTYIVDFKVDVHDVLLNQIIMPIERNGRLLVRFYCDFFGFSKTRLVILSEVIVQKFIAIKSFSEN